MFKVKNQFFFNNFIIVDILVQLKEAILCRDWFYISIPIFIKIEWLLVKIWSFLLFCKVTVNTRKYTICPLFTCLLFKRTTLCNIFFHLKYLLWYILLYAIISFPLKINFVCDITLRNLYFLHFFLPTLNIYFYLFSSTQAFILSASASVSSPASFLTHFSLTMSWLVQSFCRASR